MHTTTTRYPRVVEEIDPLRDPRWAALVDSAPDAEVFHHPLWLALLRERYRYPISAVCVGDSAGELLAGIPVARIESRLTGRRLVSVPFSDLCPPIARDDGSRQRLVGALDETRRRAGLPLEIHAPVPELPDGGTSDRFYHHTVPLSAGAEVVLGKQVKQSKRRGARLAQESGVTIRRATDRDAIDAFFRLQVLTRRRLGVPTQPRSFFRGLANLFDHALGFVLLA